MPLARLPIPRSFNKRQETHIDTQFLRNRPGYTLDRETAPAMWLVGTLWLVQATGVQTHLLTAPRWPFGHASQGNS